MDTYFSTFNSYGNSSEEGTYGYGLNQFVRCSYCGGNHYDAQCNIGYEARQWNSYDNYDASCENQDQYVRNYASTYDCEWSNNPYSPWGQDQRCWQPQVSSEKKGPTLGELAAENPNWKDDFQKETEFVETTDLEAYLKSLKDSLGINNSDATWRSEPTLEENGVVVPDSDLCVANTEPTSESSTLDDGAMIQDSTSTTQEEDEKGGNNIVLEFNFYDNDCNPSLNDDVELVEFEHIEYIDIAPSVFHNSLRFVVSIDKEVYNLLGGISFFRAKLIIFLLRGHGYNLPLLYFMKILVNNFDVWKKTQREALNWFSPP